MTQAQKNYFYKTKWIKMGRWALLPADSENWHGEETSRYFKKLFGFAKGTLAIHVIDETLSQNCYFPRGYFKTLYQFISKINKKDHKAIAQKLNSFYNLKKKAKHAIPQISAKNYQILSTNQLVKLYKQNRDWAHRVTVFDQFGWTAEEYWPPLMEKILVKKYGLAKNSAEYHRVLFVLTKPEEISTTLEEKRDVIFEAIKIKQKKQSLKSVSKKLAKKYGWMPVFTFGVPWDAVHYEQELSGLSRKNLGELEKEYKTLINYKSVRNNDLQAAVKKYSISEQDLQMFIDFGLALDARNEAEYLVSLAGFYLLPIYREAARRLSLSLKQIRSLYEKEIVQALEGKIDAERVLERKGKYIGWGFDKTFLKRINFNALEAEKLYKYIEKRVTNLQGNDESVGVCASPGKVQGTAKIMHSPDENNKIKPGDILITHATTVDYLPAMKRAAAFVTEVGGLTCHAAVVAREFGVPCVVGLKNATVNFKDGDRVEVDANKGIVRRL